MYGEQVDSEYENLNEQLSERDRRIEMSERELSAKNLRNGSIPCSAFLRIMKIQVQLKKSENS